MKYQSTSSVAATATMASARFASFTSSLTAAQFSASTKDDKHGTRRAWKTEQLKQFGDYVPVLRARGYLDNGNVINLSYGGEIYESPLTWEGLFQE